MLIWQSQEQDHVSKFLLWCWN